MTHRKILRLNQIDEDSQKALTGRSLHTINAEVFRKALNLIAFVEA